MRLQRGYGRPNTSSQIYKKPERMTFFETVIYYMNYIAKVGWSFLRQSGWIVTSGFVILVLPSVLMQMFEYESLISQNFEQ